MSERAIQVINDAFDDTLSDADHAELHRLFFFGFRNARRWSSSLGKHFEIALYDLFSVSLATKTTDRPPTL